jgi:hypothetical protein
MMADFIRPSKPMAPSSDGEITYAAMDGLISIRDNEGNVYRERELTCAKQYTVTLGYDENVMLLDTLLRREHFAFWHSAIRWETLPDGIPIQSDIESPLQRMCRRLDAELFHSKQQSPPPHAIR